MKKSPLYTRTGDSGMTSLVDGTRVPKNSPRVSAYGTIDELNAMIGLLQAHITDNSDNSESSDSSDKNPSKLSTLPSQLSPLNSPLPTPDNSDSSDSSDNPLNSILYTLNSILSTLFDIGAYLATPVESPTKNPDNSDSSDYSDKTSSKLSPLNSKLIPRLSDLEHQIDLLDSLVPPMRFFVLPGGSIPAAHAHVARTICRRAERDIITLTDTGAHVEPIVLNYINRLSDYLFILARYLNHLTSTPEITWRP